MRFVFFISFIPVLALANSDVEMNGFELSQSRIIVKGNDNGKISVSNNTQAPLIAKFNVVDSAKNKSTEWFIAPPIVRIEPDDSTSVLITNRVNNKQPVEVMYWFCAKAILPVDKTPSTGFSTKIRVLTSNCVKLLYRSPMVRDKKIDEQNSIVWQSIAGKRKYLKAINSSPFYFIIPANEFIKDNLILHPSANIEVALSRDVLPGEIIKWDFINDDGAKISASSAVIEK